MKHWEARRIAACPTCGAKIGEFCTTRSGRVAEAAHAARLDAARPQPTADELVARQREAAMHEARWATSVRTTFVLSCGCVQPTSEPIPRREWPVTEPGAVTICDAHNEYAVVVEVRTRLVADVATLTRLFVASGALDEIDAESVAAAQADEPASRVTAPG